MLYRNRDTGRIASRDQLADENPHLAQVLVWDQEVLDQLGVDFVHETTPPTVSITQRAWISGSYWTGTRWETEWVVQEISDPEHLAVALQAAKSVLKALISQVHEEVSTSGIPYDFGPFGVLTVQTRKAPYDDRLVIQSLLALGTPTVFRTAENINVPLSGEEVVAMCRHVQGALVVLRSRSFSLKDQVDAAQTFEELNAIQVSL